MIPFTSNNDKAKLYSALCINYIHTFMQKHLEDMHTPN